MMKMRCVLMMLCLFLGTAFVQAGTVAYWEFDDAAPGESLLVTDRTLDSSGNGFDLRTITEPFPFVEGNPAYGDTAAQGMLPSYNGILIHQPGYDFGDGGAVAAPAFQLPYTGAMTFEACVRIPRNSDKAGILNRDRVDDDAIWWRVEAGGYQRFCWRFKTGATTGYNIIAVGTANIMDGKWHHIAAIKEWTGTHSQVSVYFDYVLDGATATTTYYDDFDTSGDMYIGSFPDSTTSDFEGSIDFIKISEGALSPSQFVQPINLPTNPLPGDGDAGVAISTSALEWDVVAGAVTNLDQTVTIATDADFANVVEQFDNVTGDTVSLSSSLDGALTYFWKVDSDYIDPNSIPISSPGLVWSFTTAETNPSVVADWVMDDGTPGASLTKGGRIVDISGNNRDLTITGMRDVFEFAEYESVPMYDIPGAAYGGTSSVEFNLLSDGLVLNSGNDFGDGGYVAGSQFHFAAADSYTFETIVKFDEDVTTTCGFFAQGYVWEYCSLWWRIESSGLQRFYVRGVDDVTHSLNGTTFLYDGQWHHLAAVKDASAGTITLYVDGAVDSVMEDVTNSDVATEDIASVACTYDLTSRELDGNMQRLKISRTALAPQAFLQAVDLPEVISPSDGETVVPITTQLSWNPIDDGSTIVSQTVLVSQDRYMAVIDQTLDGSGNVASPSPVLEANTNYYWRVDTELGDASTRAGQVWTFRTPICLLTAEDGDLNGNCLIDLSDFAIMSGNWLLSIYE